LFCIPVIWLGRKSREIYEHTKDQGRIYSLQSRKDNVQIPLSDYIRQLRRQRGLTQTELGGDLFSKSYVSAVELEKISPSLEALRFFAEQLEQPVDLLEQLLSQAEQGRASSAKMNLSLYQPDTNEDWEEMLTLLDLAMEGKELPHTMFLQELSTRSIGTMLDLPLQQQAHYFFLKGLLSQEQGDLQNARSSLERALALSPMKYQPVILDTLGTNFYLEQMYQTALLYHERALRVIQTDEAREKSPNLLLQVELHCGDDYRALGAHTRARAHYEHARQNLRSSSNMQIAGQVYLGLGYCIYASISLGSVPATSASSSFSFEEKEQLFQLALSFLLQARTLYQVSGDRLGESKVRLLHAMVLLDRCSLYREVILVNSQDTAAGKAIQCATLLDEAEEQCRQILLTWHDSTFEAGVSLPNLEEVLYTALSSLVETCIQRAAVARINGYADTGLRARSRATQICELTLETLADASIPWSLMRAIITLPDDPATYRMQSLPCLPDLTQSQLFHRPSSLAPVLFAAAQVAEELGRATTDSEYASACYMRANEFFEAFLQMESQFTPARDRDASYLVRSYQRCIALMEERLKVAPFEAEETHSAILTLFKQGFVRLHSAFLPFPSVNTLV
jgi:transcriptional regulator with XRE-family HTH domain